MTSEQEEQSAKAEDTVIHHKRIPLKVADDVAVKEFGVEGIKVGNNLPQSPTHDSSRTI